MANKDLKRKPCRIDGHDGEAWWYEESKGICVVCEFREDGVLHETKVMHIPWGKVENALRRKRLGERGETDDGDE